MSTINTNATGVTPTSSSLRRSQRKRRAPKWKQLITNVSRASQLSPIWGHSTRTFVDDRGRGFETAVTGSQEKILEQKYKETTTPLPTDILELVRDTGLEIGKIQGWFRKRRASQDREATGAGAM